jgi:hypothetical protein
MLAASPRRLAVVALAALPIAACSLGSSTARFSRASRYERPERRNAAEVS